MANDFTACYESSKLERAVDKYVVTLREGVQEEMDEKTGSGSESPCLQLGQFV